MANTDSEKAIRRLEAHMRENGLCLNVKYERHNMNYKATILVAKQIYDPNVDPVYVGGFGKSKSSAKEDAARCYLATIEKHPKLRELLNQIVPTCLMIEKILQAVEEAGYHPH